MIRSLTLVGLLIIQGALPPGRTSISGQVATETSEPAARIRVAALEAKEGSSDQSLISLTETDEKGRYRLDNIPPGRYYIVAGALSRPTYYPGVTDRSFAQVVTVSAAGELKSIDFPIAPALPPLTASDRRARQEPCAPTFVFVDVRSAGAPYVLAADRAGNVFFTQAHSNTVRKLSPDGKVSVFAGNGLIGHGGDGGPATAAPLGQVNVLAVDPAGNLYIAEGSFRLQSGFGTTPQNSLQPAPRVRKVTPDGTITTIAGNGVTGYTGDGGPAVSASLCPTTGLTADGLGNIYIAADPGPTYRDFMVRKVDSAGVITTVPRSVVYRPDPFPMGIFTGLMRVHAVADTTGNLFIVGDGHIQKITPAGGISTVANINATDADSGVAMDNSGNLFLADSGRLRMTSGTVVKFTSAGGPTPVAGTGAPDASAATPSLATPLHIPQSNYGYDAGALIAADGAGNLFIAETETVGGKIETRIRKVTPQGAISTVFTSTPEDVFWVFTAPPPPPVVKLLVQVISAIPPASSLETVFGGNLEPAAPVALLELVGGTLPQIATVSMNPPTEGRNEFSVIRGSYEVFASLPDIHGWDNSGPAVKPFRQRSFGRSSVSITDNPTAVTVNVHPGIDLIGHIIVDGRPAAPTGGQIHLQPDSIAARIAVYQTVVRYRPPIAPDGSFKFPALPEARYTIVFEAPQDSGLALDDILLDGKSVLDSGIAVGASPLGAVELRLHTIPAPKVR